MTEIPAKTPRPMGRTESFFPGRVKEVLDASAAAAAAAEAAEADADDEVAESAAATGTGLFASTAELVVGVGVATSGDGAEEVAAAVDVPGTVDRPLTLTAGGRAGVEATLVMLAGEDATDETNVGVTDSSSDADPAAVAVAGIELETGDAVAATICEDN